jgi:hypothetical protein
LEQLKCFQVKRSGSRTPAAPQRRIVVDAKHRFRKLTD